MRQPVVRPGCTGPTGSDLDGGCSAAARQGATIVDEESGAGFSTTLLSENYTAPSFAVAGTSFANPAPDLRRSRPSSLNETLIEARLSPDGPMQGGWAIEVYERRWSQAGQAPPAACSDKSLGRADQPDADGIYRIVLAPGAWQCNALAAIFYSDGDPAGAIAGAHVDVWTTTFEGMAMPPGFTAVPA